MSGEGVAAILGGIIGVALVAYAFVYVPMKANYDECGRVTLCHPTGARHDG